MAWYNPFTWGEGEKVNLDPNTGKLPNAQEIEGLSRSGMREARNRQAPLADRTMVAPVRTGTGAQLGGAQNQFRSREMALADRLSGIFTGAAPGAGEMAVQRQGDRALAQTIGNMRGARGGNAGMALQAGARTAANIGLDVAGAAAQAQAQDQQMAAGQLAGVLGQGRAQDVNVAGQNAQLAQQMNLANLSVENQRIFEQAGLDQARSLADQQSKLATMGMNDQASIAYLSQLYGVSVAQMQGLLAKEGLKLQNYDPGWGANLMGQIGQGAITYATSDRRAKKKIVAAKDVDSMLERIKAFEYEYIDPDKPLRGRGRQVSVMADDLEKSAAGREMVERLPDGTKVVNYGKGLGTMLAAVARVHERLSAVEEGK